ncbi:MAG: hypothetical protein LBI86_12135 [Treponema sp.]|nr:hypothetical protein [Treponema sp.]
MGEVEALLRLRLGTRGENSMRRKAWPAENNARRGKAPFRGGRSATGGGRSVTGGGRSVTGGGRSTTGGGRSATRGGRSTACGGGYVRNLSGVAGHYKEPLKTRPGFLEVPCIVSCTRSA